MLDSTIASTENEQKNDHIEHLNLETISLSSDTLKKAVLTEVIYA